MSPYNPDCDTCTYAWCCGNCDCCKPRSFATGGLVGEGPKIELTQCLYETGQWLAYLPCSLGGTHQWRKSRIDLVSFGKAEPVRHYEHWTCAKCGLVDAVERDCGA